MSVCILILSHERPQCVSADYIKNNSKYPWYIVLDNSDTMINEYINKFGAEHIIIYDKQIILNDADAVVRDKKPTSALYSRIAIELIGTRYDYFVMMDDDLTDFKFRYVNGESLGTQHFAEGDFDKVLDAFINYLSVSPKLLWLCFGINSTYVNGVKVFSDEFISTQRLGYQVFIRKATEQIDWVSIIYQDLIASITYAQRGYVNLTLPQVTYSAYEMGGKVDGGLSDYYRSTSTLYRSMFCYVTHPDCVKIIERKKKYVPSTIKENAFPKIISERYKNERV